jgi:hypothetical protein
MGDQLYTAERDHRSDHTDLEATINEYGRLEADRLQSKYGYEIGIDTRTVHIEITTWANGPLLYIEETKNGERAPPTLDNKFTTEVFAAGYIPWGFRPEQERDDSGGRVNTGRWMWYLRQIADIEDDDFPNTSYAIETDDDEYVRDEDGTLITFDSKQKATAISNVSDGNVVEINR